MILEKVLDHAVEHPNSIAIVDDKRTLTYREMIYGGHLFVDHLRSLCPQSDYGDKVGILIPPTAAFAVALGGTRWDSRIAIPLNYLLKPEELAAIVKDAGLKVIFTIEHFKPLAEAVAQQAGCRIIYFESLTFAKPGLAVMTSIALDPANLRKHVHPIPPRKDDDVAVIMYTSGTAGRPKGVMLTNRNLESNAIDSCQHARFTQRTIFLGVLPMFHTLGLMGNLMIPLYLGSKMVFQARFSPVGVFELVQKHQIEVLIMVPTMYAVMANAKSGNAESLKSVKIALSGGEPLPVPLIGAFQQKFNLTLMEGFGLTETAPIVALSVPWAHKPGAVGKIIPDVQVKTVDDDGHDLPPGVDGGELYIKGPNVMKGYFNQPELTDEVLLPPDADGLRWFKTGDIARLDEEGFLYITGRKKDMIIMAGEKVFPREIEEAIKQHPSVLMAAVVGVKDPQRGELPVAFVQLKPEAGQENSNLTKPTDQEIRNFVRQKIAPFKTPRDVYFLDQMPMTHTGKILKRELLAKIPPSSLQSS